MVGFLSALAVYLGAGQGGDLGFSKVQKNFGKIGVIPVGKN